jgi:hypothetical protein
LRNKVRRVFFLPGRARHTRSSQLRTRYDSFVPSPKSSQKAPCGHSTSTTSDCARRPPAPTAPPDRCSQMFAQSAQGTESWWQHYEAEAPINQRRFRECTSGISQRLTQLSSPRIGVKPANAVDAKFRRSTDCRQDMERPAPVGALNRQAKANHLCPKSMPTRNTDGRRSACLSLASEKWNRGGA